MRRSYLHYLVRCTDTVKVRRSYLTSASHPIRAISLRNLLHTAVTELLCSMGKIAVSPIESALIVGEIGSFFTAILSMRPPFSRLPRAPSVEIDNHTRRFRDESLWICSSFCCFWFKLLFAFKREIAYLCGGLSRYRSANIIIFAIMAKLK